MHACDYSLTPSQSILNAPRAARLPNCIPLDTSLMAHALEALSGAVVSTICRTLALDYVGPQHGAPPPLTCSPAAPLGPCALAPSPSAPRAARRDSSRSRGPATRCGTGSWPGSTCSCAPERRWTWRTCRSGEPPTYRYCKGTVLEKTDLRFRPAGWLVLTHRVGTSCSHGRHCRRLCPLRRLQSLHARALSCRAGRPHPSRGCRVPLLARRRRRPAEAAAAAAARRLLAWCARC